MGKAKEYIPILLSSFISLSAIMALVAMVYPAAFTLIPVIGYSPESDSTHVVVSDSLAARSDSLESNPPEIVVEDSASHKSAPNETAEKPEVEDTTMHATQQLAQQGVRVPVARQTSPGTLSAAEMRKMVQIFESMDAENAARILLKMDDFAIRQVIAVMKKRQSAKILAVLEPERAARILNGKIEQ